MLLTPPVEDHISSDGALNSVPPKNGKVEQIASFQMYLSRFPRWGVSTAWWENWHEHQVNEIHGKSWSIYLRNWKILCTSFKGSTFQNNPLLAVTPKDPCSCTWKAEWGCSILWGACPWKTSTSHAKPGIFMDFMIASSYLPQQPRYIQIKYIFAVAAVCMNLTQTFFPSHNSTTWCFVNDKWHVVAVHVYSLTSFCQHPLAHDLDPQREAPRNLEISSPWYAYLAANWWGTAIGRLELESVRNGRKIGPVISNTNPWWKLGWRFDTQNEKIRENYQGWGVVQLPTQVNAYFSFNKLSKSLKTTLTISII